MEIRLESFTLASSRVNVKISQSFPLSSILYLFYNINLLENYENASLRISLIEFVDDVNIFIYGLTI
jgi:hypothetical protein